MSGTGGHDLSARRLYLCTPDRPDLARFLADCIAGGVDVVQLRDKELDATPLLARAAVASAVCRDLGVPFVLNDRPDLALEVGADGVHVGQDDAPVSLARRIMGPDAIVGLSTHGPADLEGAAAEDVTYISAGPVEATPTKPGRPGTGLDYVTQASARSSVPVRRSDPREDPRPDECRCPPLCRCPLSDPRHRCSACGAGAAAGD